MKKDDSPVSLMIVFDGKKHLMIKCMYVQYNMYLFQIIVLKVDRLLIIFQLQE